MKFLYCLIYLAITGIIVFLVGRIVPLKWMRENRFPFQSFAFERDGRIYDKLKISRWKDKVPDASRFIAKVIPSFMKKKK